MGSPAITVQVRYRRSKLRVSSSCGCRVVVLVEFTHLLLVKRISCVFLYTTVFPAQLSGCGNQLSDFVLPTAFRESDSHVASLVVQCFESQSKLSHSQADCCSTVGNAMSRSIRLYSQLNSSALPSFLADLFATTSLT